MKTPDRFRRALRTVQRMRRSLLRTATLGSLIDDDVDTAMMAALLTHPENTLLVVLC